MSKRIVDPEVFEAGEDAIAPTLSFTITGRIPTKKNSLRRIQRGGRVYTVPGADYEQWERSHAFDLIGFPQLKPPYRIEVVFFPPCRRKADLSNKFEGIADLLVRAKVFQDDSWFMLSEVLLKFGGVDKANPRAEVSIFTPNPNETPDVFVAASSGVSSADSVSSDRFKDSRPC